MKRSVSIVASLFACTALLAGCGGAAAGKTEFTQLCMKRMGNSQPKCDCYVTSIETALTPDEFARLAKGAHDNRNFSGTDWLPGDIRSNAKISNALHEATTTCMQSV